ncbi:hypothetical protein A3I46_03390 [Candidatus Kaiserbacteria bacterium RIFCSPLOWO2_02_FULL_54_13]|uniref:Uncharacterized protein n=1 Tax=Candidatus Kaiserbacteria bacterium RIFCSPHIGHO2_02_FULL_54_22 TaxID=1798495 RepID=A0A1F6DMD8_9BACT|nr:MAG: hypothetical protein A3C19_01060 [Candidatus Kaiserbacteria bacterium RIFCSPHIGHO2_02_FULL_54_22]OGG67918.1 MAG: hypothetical protein A3E99_03045 [Candidatus Kaiserbacteria bacterium RIFCSPHIGHO2_12_FULL_54_16]OGG82514.1 MAG: hypothetical protein A3I46_03390 [Candidatus Kaiserbacteria bacterium RIFCSPLOWO2_02_FULL_54_13]OGG89814.1 MAG: hypothetical protein A3G12_01915 [Candidatus Kaiserbacteria bacterium RIFCSPLOWO2_12_FULL_54_10]
MTKRVITIEETEHIVDDHFFDVVGNEFKDHVKGLAEWLKNSVDAYNRKGTPSNEQYIQLKFIDEEMQEPVIECVDFIGITEHNIEDALKRWGDPMAAKHGKKIKTYGGHGNGGKFYMRQAFDTARFITYKNGLLNVFGFSEGGRYGYAKGLKNVKMDPAVALKFANVDPSAIPQSVKNEIISGQTGFTVVLGEAPFGVGKKFKRLTKDLERLKNHPQSRRILERANVAVYYNGNILDARLKPEALPPLERFEEPRVIIVPETLTLPGAEKVTVEMGNAKYPQGKLTLRTSAEPLAQGVKPGELNRVDILGEIGAIGSYQLFEMNVTGFPHAAFIYGEFGPAHDGEATILENPENDCVSNDRAKLVVNDTTRALIAWIALEVDKLATDIAALEKEKQKLQQKDITLKFNDVLNEWKNKHMRKIMSDLFGGGTGGGSGGDDGSSGTEVTEPVNGFDFKYPKEEIEPNTPGKLTLKINVPQALPLGAIINFSSSSDKISIEDKKIAIKSDFLKATPNGQQVGFINLIIVGLEAGTKAIITASAGKLSATTEVTVVAEKDKKSGSAFPKVLLSGQNTDPLGLAAGGILYLSERDPVVYQRPQDFGANIFWINTTSPMASKIYERFTPESVQWRNFLFERYVDIFVKEAIYELERKDFENFNAGTVDQKIAEVVRRTHQSAKDDLEQFLFDESYEIKR